MTRMKITENKKQKINVDSDIMYQNIFMLILTPVLSQNIIYISTKWRRATVSLNINF